MPINNDDRVAGPFTSGSTFPFDFKVFQATDMKVVEKSALGVETVLTYPSGFTVSLNPDQDVSPGGSVTRVAGAISGGVTITVTSAIDYTQPVTLTNGGAFFANVITDALDRATIGVQQLATDLNRAIKFPISDGQSLENTLPTAANRLGKALVFDATTGGVGVSTRAYDDQGAVQAAASAAAAAASQTAAAASASSASTSATTATTQATSATASATAAAASATSASTDAATATAQAALAVGAAAPAAALTQRTSGITDMFINPNLIHDGVYAQALALTPGGSSTKTLNTTCFSNSACTITNVNTANGRLAMKVAGNAGLGTLVVAQTLTDIGTTAGSKMSFSGRITARTGYNAATVVQLRQYSSAYGTEITGVRQSYTVPTDAALTADAAFSFRDVTLDAACVAVGFAFSAFTSEDFTVVDLMMAKGSVSDYRPYLKNVATATALATTDATAATAALTATALALRTEGVTDMFTNPNLYRDALYTDTIASNSTRTKNNDLYSKTASGFTVVSATVDGRPAFTIAESIAGEKSLSWRNSLARLGLTTSDKVSFSCKITNRSGANTAATRVLLRQFTDTAGSENNAVRQTQLVTAAPLTSDMIVKFENVTIDPTTVEIGLYWSVGTTSDTYTVYDVCFARGAVGDFRPTWEDYIMNQARFTQYQSPSGSDSNPGTLASPKLTLTGAKNALYGKTGTIICRGGDNAYNALNSLDLSDCPGIRIIAAANEIPQFFFGEKILGAAFTNVGGATPNVFSATMAAANGTNLDFVFDHGVPYGTISTAERHPLHRGRTYRCDSTPWYIVGSLATCNTTAGSCFVSGTTLYVNPPSGSMTGKTIYVPNYAAIVSGGVAGVTNYFEMTGIIDRYANEGPNLRYVLEGQLNNCISIGGKTNGFRFDNSNVKTDGCEAWGAGNDGFNIHGPTPGAPDPTIADCRYTHIATYSHDNWDDGMSHHERCQMIELGGLFEYNGGDGVVPANGAHAQSISSHARQNGSALGVAGVGTGAASGKGAGFGVTNAVGANEGGISTDYTLVECTSENNDSCIYATADTLNIIHAYRCRLGTATGLAKVKAANNGKVYLHDCTEFGTGTTKNTATGGTITVENGTLIT